MTLTLRTLHQLSKMGQNEVARSYQACRVNLMAAGGAGLITALTVVFKVLIAHTSLNPFEIAFFTMIGFAASFILMQILGFRLATKQAPLLGAALGKKWEEVRNALLSHKLLSDKWRAGLLSHSFMNEKWQARLKTYNFLRAEWLSEITWSTRTQLFSALGNFLFVVPAAFAFHYLYYGLTGANVLSPLGARAALASLNPGHGTLAYAAFTGGLLWLCTFLGGLIANYFGPFSKQQATTFFNICLGAMLAFAPLLGKWLELPIDVRHFTLSGGTAAIAVASLGFAGAMKAGLLTSLLGVLLIGFLNFSVSFTLAFIASTISSRWKGLPTLRTVDLRAYMVPQGLTIR